MARELVATQDNTSTSALTEPLSREVARPIFGESVLAIDYNFADKQILDSDITFSRASGALQTNSSGLVAYAPSNSIGFSEDFSNGWSVSGSSVTGASYVDPFGNSGVYLFKPSNNYIDSVVSKNATSEQQGASYVTSVYAKASGKNFLVVRDVVNSGSTPYAWFDLSTGTVGEVKNNGTATIEDVGNSWYRCSIKGTASSTTITAAFYVCNANNSLSSTINGDDGILLFGAQIEKSFADAPSSYIKTISASKEQAPRFDYDKDGNSKGLLVEEARDNLYQYSQELSKTGTGAWTHTGVSVPAASNTLDPSGGYGSYKVQQDTSTGAHFIARGFSVTSGTTYTASIFVKYVDQQYVVLDFSDSFFGGSAVARFDIKNGQVASASDGADTITDYGNGWYRISCSCVATATGFNSMFISHHTGLTNSFAGDGVSSILMFGAQAEAGAFPTSLIPTYGAAATRAADLVSVTGTNFSRFFKDSEGAVVVDFQLHKDRTNLNYKRLISFNDGTTANTLDVYGQNNYIRSFGDNASSGYLGLYPTTIEAGHGEITKVGLAYKDNNFSLTGDGGSSTTDTSGIVPKVFDRLSIGSQHNGVPINSWIRRIRYYNKRQSDNKIQSLTDTSFLLDKYKGAKAAHSLRSLRDGRDASPVCSVRRDYDSAERSFTANEISDGTLSEYHTSSAQTVLPLNISCDASELVSNGDFTSNATGWTAYDSATISSENGMLKVANGSSNHGRAAQEVKVKIGKTYKVTGDVLFTAGDAVDLQFKLGTSNGGSEYYSSGDLTANTLISQTIVATGTSLYVTLQNSGNASTNGYFDNISVKEVSPLATGFSTRKINSSYTGKAMRCRNQSNVEVEVGFDDNDQISLLSPITNVSQNLLASSEDFANGWATYYSGTAEKSTVTDPFGGTNAYKITAPNASSYHGRSITTGSLTGNATYTFSCYVKKVATQENYTLIGIGFTGGSTKYCYVIVDAVNGTATFDTSGSTSATPYLSVTEPVTGWYRIAITVKDTGNNNSSVITIYGGGSANGTNASNVVGSVTVYGAQLSETLYESTGTEKITNGDFDTNTSGWTAQDAHISIASVNGEAELTAIGSSSFMFQVFTTKVGAKYTLSAYGRVGTGADSVNIQARDGTDGAYIAESSSTTDGTVSLTFIALSTTSTIRLNVTDSSLPSKSYFDNVSALEYDPELQTYAQTPAIADDDSSTTETTLGGFSGLENLIPYSSTLMGTGWSNNANEVVSSGHTDPFGGTTALLHRATGTDPYTIKTDCNVVAGQKYVWSIYMKGKGSTIGKVARLQVWFGVGTATGPATYDDSYTLTDEWQRFEIEATPTGSGTTTVRFDAPSVAVLADEVYISSPQLNINSAKTYVETVGNNPLTGDVNVVNWYDQNGGEDATQSTANYQPFIVRGSELCTDNGKACLQFIDGYRFLALGDLSGMGVGHIFSILSSQYDPPDGGSTQGQGRIWEFGSTGDNSHHPHNNGALYHSFGTTVRKDTGTTPEDYTQTHLVSIKSKYADWNMRFNGNSKISTTSNAVGFATACYLGSPTTAPWTGKFSEVVLFPADMDTKRFPIEQNMLNHFGIDLYSLDFEGISSSDMIDSVFGVSGSETLGTVTFSAETADPISGTQSLKCVHTSGNNGSYPRIAPATGYRLTEDVELGAKYRLTFDTKLISGNTTIHNISFTDGSDTPPAFLKATDDDLVLSGSQSHSYEITVTDLTGITDRVKWSLKGNTTAGTFLLDNIKIEKLGVQGFVTKLYDQTGNNCHATQDTAAQQCRLVAGGDLITSGGKPAWDFTSDTSQLVIQGLTGISHLDSLLVTDTSDTKFMLANSSNTYFMLSAESGSTFATLDNVGGSPTYRINGSAFSGHRGQAATSLNGRKLLYILSGATTNWNSYELGDSYYDSSWSYVGKMSETVFWDSDQSSNQAGIESNINTHYSIY